MPYITAPIQDPTQRCYRYFVELVSKKLDCEGDAEDCQIVDVVVTEPTEAAIKTLIAATGWLEGYSMVGCWVPEDCAEF